MFRIQISIVRKNVVYRTNSVVYKNVNTDFEYIFITFDFVLDVSASINTNFVRSEIDTVFSFGLKMVYSKFQASNLFV